MAELRQLMEHCRRAPRSFTPSDFPLARLSQNELDLILASGDIENIYPPSPMQQGMLYHTLQAPAIGLYVNQLCLELEGNLDQAAFRNAWDQVIQRHPALRTSFIWKCLDQPIEIVNRRVRLDFAQDKLGGANRDEQRRTLDDYLRTDRAFEFDLERAPLMRIKLLRANDQISYLLWTYHNLLLDGWSVPLVLKEVLQFYQASLENKEVRLSSPPPYSEYVRWIQQQDRNRAHEFWHELLSGFDSPIRLEIDGRQRNNSAAVGLDKQVLRLSRDETQQLEHFAQSHSLTLNTVVQGAWSVLLANYSGQSDVVFGTATAGRPADILGVSEMVGLFINTLPVRVQLHRDTTPLACLRFLQAQQSEARRFEYSPLVDIQSWSDLPRGTSLFECLFVFENYPVDATLQFQPKGLNIRNSSAQEATNYPLNAVVTPGHSLALQIAYDPQRFSRRSVRRMLEHWQQALREIVKHPTQPMNRLQMLCPQERKQLLSVWNGTTEDSSSLRCVHEMFEAQVDRDPTAIAAVFKDQRLRYGELNERSNQLARHLQSLGVTAEVRVGILLNRGFDLLIAIFAVLKAGGAYVPLSPEYPKDRLKYIVQDAAAPLVLSRSDCCANCPETSARLVLLDRESEQIATHATTNLQTTVLPENLAYVIYTSGSTGEPKGVLIAHCSVSNLANAQIQAFEVSNETTLLQFVASSFDAAVSDWSSALLAGGRLVLVEDGIIGGERLHSLLRETRVNIAAVPPGVLALTSVDGLPDLVTVITGGEQLSTELATKWAPGRRMINAYGPTECTVTSSLALIEPRQRPAIGRPISNLQIYVLNQELEMAPVGVAGEIHIAGVGLARGYLNQPGLTAERFVANPFSTEPGARMYRTCDLGRWTFDGTLEYLGRIDDQIKIRGYRVEPGDIETALRQSAGVSDAAVVPHVDQNGNQRLIAYVVMNRDLPDGCGQFRGELSKKLPMYMVPSVFHRLEALPRTATGKLDRKALSIIDVSALSDDCPYVAPRTEVEKMLCEIWAQVLGKKQIGTQETFWDAGGHSLLATQMLEQVRRVCGIELEVRHLFEGPTVKALAEIIESCPEGPSTSGTLLDEIESLPEHEVTSLIAKLQRS
jgi:amino acid adenylation domain-containing protein